MDNGNVHDQNGDGWACFRENKGQSAKNQYPSYTWKGNTTLCHKPGIVYTGKCTLVFGRGQTHLTHVYAKTSTVNRTVLVARFLDR